MPIRFRCVYCNQLLGIARRKAGKIVGCTNCGGQLIVPDPAEGSDADRSDAGAKTEAPAGVFERDDFDAVLESAAPAPSASAVASPPSVRPKPVTMSSPPLLAPPTVPMNDLAGKIVLSRSVVTMLAALCIIMIGLAFLAGLLVGMAVK